MYTIKKPVFFLVVFVFVYLVLTIILSPYKVEAQQSIKLQCQVCYEDGNTVGEEECAQYIGEKYGTYPNGCELVDNFASCAQKSISLELTVGCYTGEYNKNFYCCEPEFLTEEPIYNDNSCSPDNSYADKFKDPDDITDNCDINVDVEECGIRSDMVEDEICNFCQLWGNSYCCCGIEDLNYVDDSNNEIPAPLSCSDYCEDEKGTGQYEPCKACVCDGEDNLTNNVWTEIGCITATEEGIIVAIMRVFFGVATSIAVLRFVQAAFMLNTDDPEKIKEGKKYNGEWCHSFSASGVTNSFAKFYRNEYTWYW